MEASTFSKISSKPILKLDWPFVAIEVYQAKKLYELAWNSPDLKLLVKEARKTYRRFNINIPLLDTYDNKSTVYLAKATYDGVEEWISVRFTPLKGQPHSTEDFDLYHCQHRESKSSQTLLQVVKNHFSDLKEESVFSISRLCAIRPRKTEKTLSSLESNKYTSLLFSTIILSFLKDQGDTMPYITIQLHDKFRDKIFSYLNLNDFKETLKAKSLDLKLNRQEKYNYIYNYPGYFLDLRQFIDGILEIFNKYEIPPRLLDSYLPSHLNHQDLLDSDKILYFHIGKLSRLFKEIEGHSNGKIDKLKFIHYLNERVADGPSLYIETGDHFLKHCEALILKTLESKGSPTHEKYTHTTSS